MSDAYTSARDEIRRSIDALQKADALLAEKLDPLMTVDDVAAYWQCSKQHVYNMATSGVLKSIRIGTGGSERRFRRSDVLAIGVDEKA